MQDLAVQTNSQATWWQALKNPRVLCILFLGFSSGLPLALSTSTLQAWFAVDNINVKTVGLLSLLGLPYVWKFLWSPLMDYIRLPGLDRRRSWILLTQALLVVAIAAMALFSPIAATMPLAIIAFTIAFFSASQDISIDAYRTDLLEPHERGPGAAMNTFGYRIAMLVSGGLALVMAGELGFKATYLIMAGLMAVQLLVTWLSPAAPEAADTPKQFIPLVKSAAVEFFTRRSAIMILVFIVVYKLGDAFALSLTSFFLIHGLHFTLLDVGAIYKGVGLISTMVGVFFGGLFMVRLGLYRSLLIFGIFQALSNLTFMLLAMAGKSYMMMVVAIAAENLTGGMATVAFVAFLMALCDKRFTAMQFALLSALSAVGRVLVGPMAAEMVAHIGWIHFYFWTFIIALPGLVVLVYLKSRVNFAADKVA